MNLQPCWRKSVPAAMRRLRFCADAGRHILRDLRHGRQGGEPGQRAGTSPFRSVRWRPAPRGRGPRPGRRALRRLRTEEQAIARGGSPGRSRPKSSRRTSSSATGRPAGWPAEQLHPLPVRRGIPQTEVCELRDRRAGGVAPCRRPLARHRPHPDHPALPQRQEGAATSGRAADGHADRRVVPGDRSDHRDPGHLVLPQLPAGSPVGTPVARHQGPGRARRRRRARRDSRVLPGGHVLQCGGRWCGPELRPAGDGFYDPHGRAGLPGPYRHDPGRVLVLDVPDLQRPAQAGRDGRPVRPRSSRGRGEDRPGSGGPTGKHDHLRRRQSLHRDRAPPAE